jgi:hypothetical protein
MEGAGFTMLGVRIKNMPDFLADREMRERCFGFKDGCGRTLEEVGRRFQVTREWIRQIEAKDLRNMCNPRVSKSWEASAGCPAILTSICPEFENRTMRKTAGSDILIRGVGSLLAAFSYKPLHPCRIRLCELPRYLSARRRIVSEISPAAFFGFYGLSGFGDGVGE